MDIWPMDFPPSQLSNLRRLEAESIHIIREVAAEFSNPVMLYSIGKDSGVMLHLAMKAFYPSKPPFPLLHVDTTWKFRDMITFRDETAKRLGLDLLVYTNPEGLEKGIGPFSHGSSVHTHVMKTEALKQALDKYGFDAAFGGARRDACFLSAIPTMAGIRKTSARSCGTFITPALPRVKVSAPFRCPTGPSSTSGNTSSPKTFRWCRSILPRSARWSSATAC
jgi:hypothetical protein